jgi:molybdopterin-guanine dinucleotide biosynthesis protein
VLDLGDAGEAEVVQDGWPGASPLAGIASALARYRRPMFTLAADIAFADSAALRRVLSAFPGHDHALPAVGPEYHQPLFAVYGPACLAPMTARLEAGRHHINEMLRLLGAAKVRFPDDSLFRNIDTMDDYEEARRQAAEDADAPAAEAQPALVAIVGKSDSGKTTLIEKVVPELVKLGLRVGTVKHDAHSFEIDHPGKDSWRHGQAGAHAYAIASPERLAFITKLDGEMPLADIARRFFAGFDLVVAEGYKRTAPHRVELFRVGAGHAQPLCGPGEALALVTDSMLQHEHLFGLEDGAGLARFLAVRLDSLREY